MKKLLALISALVLAAGVSAMELDAPETLAENGEAYTAETYEEETSNAGKPGYNVFTGTTAVYDFEKEGLTVDKDNGKTSDIWSAWSGAVLDSTTETENTSMKLAHSGNSGAFAVNSTYTIPAGRPFKLSYKYKTTTVGAYIKVSANNAAYTYNHGSITGIHQLSSLGSSYANGSWNTLTAENITMSVDVKKIYFCDIAGTSNIWIDDISVIPYYKVSYNLGEGTGSLADEYFLAASYTPKADTSAITAPAGEQFLYWKDQFGNEFKKGYVIPTLGYDLELTAVYGTPEENKAGKPGYNVWTGTTQPFDFEGKLLVTDGASGDINKSWSKSEIVTEDDGNHAFKLSGDHPNFTVNNEFAPVEKDRPVTISLKFKTTTEKDCFFRVRPNQQGQWKMVNNSAVRCINFILQINLKAENDGEWFTSVNTVSAKNFSDLDITSLDKIETFWFFIAQGEAALFDDISIIPNYKVSYNLGEGTGSLDDEYFLADSYTLKADTSKITAPDGMTFSHWVDKNGNIVRDTVVPTLGEDIELTAVYAKTVTLGTSNIKVTAPNGMRIAGFISNAVRDTADEYGFISALAKTFDNGDYTSLTHSLDSTKYVSAAAYVKGTDTDYIAADSYEDAYDMFGSSAVNAEGIHFTGVYVGVPADKTSYQTPIVGRTYVKIGENYFYGVPYVKTVYQAALDVKNSCADGESVPEYVQGIIDIVEG